MPPDIWRRGEKKINNIQNIFPIHKIGYYGNGAKNWLEKEI